jgi:tRNA threonylcarbamoyladenosine biosynthesis protein TsaB
MTLLAFDTCFGACSVAVGPGAKSVVSTIAHRFELMAVGHAERLVPMVQDVLTEVGLRVSDLDTIAVTHGPGSFTGTRIGVATARALALASGAQVMGFSSMAVMARQLAITQRPDCDIGVAMDVRRDEVYLQMFDPTGLTARCEPQIRLAADAAGLANGHDVLWCGTGLAAVLAGGRAQGFAARGCADLEAPDARYLVDLVRAAGTTTLAAGGTVSPLYLRAPDAKPPVSNPLARA